MTIAYKIRYAQINDLAAIVELLANDTLGMAREQIDHDTLQDYITAFANISSDSNNHLVVMEHDQQIIGVLQLTILQHLTHKGSKRGHIEGVRISSKYRGHGLGSLLIQWAIDKSRELNCRMVQLTTDIQRPEALKFYQKLGFVPSHHGLKLHL